MYVSGSKDLFNPIVYPVIPSIACDIAKSLRMLRVTPALGINNEFIVPFHMVCIIFVKFVYQLIHLLHFLTSTLSL